MDARAIWGSFVAFLTLLAICAYAATYSPSYEACKAPHANTPSHEKEQYADNFVPSSGGNIIECEAFFANVNGSAITAIATVLLTLVTGGLVWLGWIQLVTTRTQMRAQVFPKDFLQLWVPDSPTSGLYSWRFRPVWENSGETAAEKVCVRAECDIRNSIFPKGHDFDGALSSQESWEGLLPPKTTLAGGIAPTTGLISPQDIWDSQRGSKFIYLYGTVHYRDVFPSTKIHITRFCWQIMSEGDPFTFLPNNPAHTLKFSFLLHSEHNNTGGVRPRSLL